MFIFVHVGKAAELDGLQTLRREAQHSLYWKSNSKTYIIGCVNGRYLKGQRERNMSKGYELPIRQLKTSMPLTTAASASAQWTIKHPTIGSHHCRCKLSGPVFTNSVAPAPPDGQF